MQKKLKAKWLRALRSGKYTQGRDVLVSGMEKDARHCCLGVLCEVAGLKRQEYGGNVRYTDGTWSTHAGSLWDFLDIFGLTSEQEAALIQRNDGGGAFGAFGAKLFKPHSFKRIADYIERHL